MFGMNLVILPRLRRPEDKLAKMFTFLITIQSFLIIVDKGGIYLRSTFFDK